MRDTRISSRCVIRIAIMAASGTADEPSYMEAFATSMPVNWQIMVWNSFIIKRGWRDSGAPGLVVEKKLSGFADRDDIQTYVDLHDADEGRTPKYASGL